MSDELFDVFDLVTVEKPSSGHSAAEETVHFRPTTPEDPPSGFECDQDAVPMDTRPD
jgi:hypothetical protein